jgi:hypothetical protein
MRLQASSPKPSLIWGLRNTWGGCVVVSKTHIRCKNLLHTYSRHDHGIGGSSQTDGDEQASSTSRGTPASPFQRGGISAAASSSAQTDLRSIEFQDISLANSVEESASSWSDGEEDYSGQNFIPNYAPAYNKATFEVSAAEGRRCIGSCRSSCVWMALLSHAMICDPCAPANP